MVPKTIAELAADDPNLSTLVTALGAANLVDTFNGDTLFTVFAPTNAAFGALPDGALDALVADVPQLTKVLTYHVAEGELDAAAVLGSSDIDTLFGQPAAVTNDNGPAIDGAPISATDIPALNGVIHVIDAVMSPPTIAEVASANADLSTLVTALGAADLVDTFNGAGTFTVFAPTNAAFTALPDGVLDGLLADIPQLTKVLTYHVATQELDATAVTSADSIDMLFGQPAAINGANIDGAPIAITNIPAGNGIIHVIDAVMIPPTVMEVVRESEIHTTLEVAIDTAGIAAVINDTADITLFAPNDAAFGAVDQTALNTCWATSRRSPACSSTTSTASSSRPKRSSSSPLS